MHTYIYYDGFYLVRFVDGSLVYNLREFKNEKDAAAMVSYLNGGPTPSHHHGMGDAAHGEA